MPNLLSVAGLVLLLQGSESGLAELIARAKKGDFAAHAGLAKKGEDGAKALLGLLEDTSLAPPARYFAANALGDMKHAPALPVLMRLLAEDEVETVRRCCASALGFLGDKAALPALEKAAESDPGWYPNGNGSKVYLTRFRAREAIARLRGEPLPKKPVTRPPPPPPAGKPYEAKTDTKWSAALPWEPTLEKALTRAKREDRWIVATVVAVQDKRFSGGYDGARAVTAGMPDHPWGNERAAQIDAGLVKERMMLATMFGDARVAALVREHFVPVRLRLHTYLFEPKDMGLEDPLAQLGTTAREVQAPAIVYASSDGKIVHACSRIGVFSPELMLRMTAAVAKARVPEIDGEPHRARWEAALAAAARGDATAAEKLWQALARDDEAGPWGARAALRLAPHGGRVRTWETLGPLGVPELPELTDLPKTTETRVPRAELSGAIRAAMLFLLAQQDGDGAWPDPFVDMHPLAGPGSEYDRAVARTGLAVDALLKLRDVVPASDRARVDEAVQRGIACVGRFADAPQPWIWQVTYALHLQVELLENAKRERRAGAPAKLARGRADKLVATLAAMQSGGGWSYMRAPRIHSFNTAPVLLALADLRDLGVEAPAGMTDKAAAFLERLRREEEPREFAYAGNIQHKHVGSSSCRSALCELALLRHRRRTDVGALRKAIELFFEHEPAVRRTTKVYEAYFSPSAMHDAYHYFFGHYYVARALHHLPRDEAQRYAKRQLDILLGQVELDGSFVDAQMQGKAYSTAMALLTIAELLPLE